MCWWGYLLILGAYTYLAYRLSVQTGAIFNILPDYAASRINIEEGRFRMRQLVGGFILQIVSVNVLYSMMVSIGQILGTLYTRRQSIYLARLLLDDDDDDKHQYTIYHTSTLKLLPSIISHDLAELNVQLFHLLIGSMYYNGIIGMIRKKFNPLHKYFYSLFEVLLLNAFLTLFYLLDKAEVRWGYWLFISINCLLLC